MAKRQPAKAPRGNPWEQLREDTKRRKAIQPLAPISQVIGDAGLPGEIDRADYVSRLSAGEKRSVDPDYSMPPSKYNSAPLQPPINITGNITTNKKPVQTGVIPENAAAKAISMQQKQSDQIAEIVKQEALRLPQEQQQQPGPNAADFMPKREPAGETQGLSSFWEKALVAAAPIIGGALVAPGVQSAKASAVGLSALKEEDKSIQARADKEKASLAPFQLAAFKQALKTSGEKEGNSFKLIEKIGKWHSGLRITRATQDVAQSYGKIQVVASSAPSAAGDLSLIFNYMKMLDPGSTVREGEQATARQARGVPESVKTLYNRLLSGETLGKDQRADFLARSEQIYDTQIKAQSGVDNQFIKMAKRQGIKNPSDAILNFKSLVAEDTEKGTEKPSKLSSEERKDLIDFIRSRK